MSLRGLWIFQNSLAVRSDESVLFARHYATVERRCRLLNSESGNYIEIPEDVEFCVLLSQSLGFTRVTGDFVEEFDSCCLEDRKPVYDVKVKAGTIWPVVVLEKFGLVFACVPLVELSSKNERPALTELPGVSIGFTVLHNLAELFGSSREDLRAKLEEVHRYLALSLPFGTPLDLNPEIANTLAMHKDINWIPAFRLPAWKPVLNKAKQQIVFSIHEYVRAVLYDSLTHNKNVHEIYGSISCKAELDGVPEVSMDLPSPSVDYLIVHPCVTYAETHPQSSVSSSDATPSAQQSGGPTRRVQFQPSVNKFPLCHYSASHMVLPIRGIFQMKEVSDSTIHLSVCLKLGNNMKNNFDYFEVQVPFFHRGPVARMEYVPSVGAVVLTPDQRTFVWNIGQRFPKNLEANVDVTLQFAPKQAAQESSFTEDPFCKELNAYAKLVFKCSDYTYSGCNVDQKSVKVCPSNTKFKVSVVRTLVSSDYRIWNSHGDAIAAFAPVTVLSE